MMLNEIKAVLFDVFGTVVDWRGSMLSEVKQLKTRKNLNVDAGEFVDSWRAEYLQVLINIRSNKIKKMTNNEVYKITLRKLLKKHNINSFEPKEIEKLSRIDHRFYPWPDSILGIKQLQKKFIVGALSNGSLTAIVNMAKNSNLPWDVIFSADLIKSRKPNIDAYLKPVRLLKLKPRQVLLCAAHNYDLKGAAAAGLKTCFLCRPNEFGPNQTEDLSATGNWDITSTSLEQIAILLCK